MTKQKEEIIASSTHILHAQHELIDIQQEYINILVGTLRENGIDNFMAANLPDQTSSKSILHLPSQLKPQAMNPMSTPIVWTGTIDELIPVSIGNKDFVAQILSKEHIDAYNTVFNMRHNIKTCRKHFENENDQRKSIAPIISNLERLEKGWTPRDKAEYENCVSIYDNADIRQTKI